MRRAVRFASLETSPGCVEPYAALAAARVPMRRAVRFYSRPVQGYGLLLLCICYQNYNAPRMLNTFVQPMTVECIFLEFFSSEIKADKVEVQSWNMDLAVLYFSIPSINSMGRHLLQIDCAPDSSDLTNQERRKVYFGKNNYFNESKFRHEISFCPCEPSLASFVLSTKWMTLPAVGLIASITADTRQPSPC